MQRPPPATGCRPVALSTLKIKNGNTRTMCEIYSNLITETPERRGWRFLLFLLLTLNRFHMVLVFPLETRNK